MLSSLAAHQEELERLGVKAVRRQDNSDGRINERSEMYVISRKKLREFCEKHIDTCDILYDWYRVASKAQWQNLLDVQQIYPKAEAVGNFTVFNIKGNRYRMIVDLVYASQRIYIKYVLTHAGYDKDEWKNDSYF